MKLTINECLRAVPVMLYCLIAAALPAQAPTTTTVTGTVYLANGQPGAGTLVLSWPAFTTAAGQLVTADSLTVTIPADGFVSVNLAPNQGATPAGQYYTAVYYMSDGSTSTQYWVVPAAASATLAQVQAQLMPAAQAVQAVSKTYVDQAIAELAGSQLTASGGTLTGPLYLNGDPTQPLQAADKHYVDENVTNEAVPIAGGTMTGQLIAPDVNGVQSPAAGSAQTTLQQAITAAGATGAMQIPPTYAGTDTFTNPNGVFVRDWRPGAAQQIERSVKEFGAVCDGVTDDTSALQAAINYAQAHAVSLTIPAGTCKTHSLNWHGESIGGLGKQVSALKGFPGEDVLASAPDSTNLLSFTRLHDLTIYVDQSVDTSCTPAQGRAAAGSCAVSRPMEPNSIFSPGGNGLTDSNGTGAAWYVGNCAIAMPASLGTGGNGLRVAEIENVEIATTGTDPMAAQYPGAHSTHTCGLYLGQWPQWSEFRNIDIRGVNTGVAIPALPVSTPAGLTADSNRWQNVTIQAAHAFTAAAGSDNVLDNVVAAAGNSAATAEPPTGLVLDLSGTQQGWTVRNAVVQPVWSAVMPALTVATASGAVTGVTLGSEHGLGLDPYGTSVPVAFSGSCTAAATASVNSSGSVTGVTVTSGGVGCSSTTTASLNAAGTWDTAAPVNLIGGQNMAFFAGNLLSGNGGYTVWNATGSTSYGTQLDGGGGNLPGGGTYAALAGSNHAGSAYQVDQFPGADIGAKIQACVNAVSPIYGGTCDARNFTGNLSMGSNLTISTANTTVLLPCATIATANQVMVTAGTRNVALRGCALRGGSAASGSQGGTVFQYSGPGAMIQVGDPTYAADTSGFHLDNVAINTTSSTSASTQGLIAYRTQELDLESLYLLGNQNQTGMTLDGTGNYTGGTFLDDQIDGFGTAINAIGHQVANPATTDWLNASTFLRLHIDCPTSDGNPVSGTYGINLQQGDGNTFTGGDVENCATALHLGANAQNNTIVGLRNENSTNQVVADAGSTYNNWMTGGTMFTGKLTDNGTRNSFLDTFHRSFNSLNGDWYGSQQDATITNHYRLGIGAGNERGLLDRYQTDSGYRWTTGLSDATGGEQFYQILDELNNVYRVSIGQYNSGSSSTNNQTAINAAGTGAVVLNGSNNAGTGGVTIGSGGPSATTVATISNAGNAQFNGTLQVGGAAQSAGTMTVRNNADAEVDYDLWPGLTASQKGSFTYKDWNGNSQWNMVKDASNNWALNSAVGGLDSFKAYQSTNSGDTYIDASNATGHIRLNYESGSGAETDIYAGSSSSLVAVFLGMTSIKFPGLAASSGVNCLQIDNSGYISNTGSACGSGGGGGSGTVNSGMTNQVAIYTAPGTAVSGSNSVNLSGTVSGTGIQDTLRPWVDTFTLSSTSSTCGSGTDEFAKLCQLGVNANASSITGNIFRSTGVSGSTVTMSANPFAPFLLTIPSPTVGANDRLLLSPGTVYTVPSELDVPTGGEIDGQSSYESVAATPRVGTWLQAASSFPFGPLSSKAGNVLVNMGNSSSTTSSTYSLNNQIHNIGVNCNGYSTATGIENGQSQQGLEIHDVHATGCTYGIGVDNLGNGAGGAQNRFPIWNNEIDLQSGPAQTMGVTNVVVTAGGSYTQAPNVTITGCGTNPAAVASLSGSAVAAVTIVNTGGNGYGASCSPGTVSVSFDTTYGSGATAVPVIQSTPAPVGMHLGAISPSADGLYYANSVTAGAGSISVGTGVTLDNDEATFINQYVESANTGMCVGCVQNSTTYGNTVIGMRTQGANQIFDNALQLGTSTNTNSVGGFSIFGLAGSDLTNWITDYDPNGGVCRNDLSNPSVVAYMRSGQSVFSMCHGVATTGQVLANSYLNCGSCTTANEPRQYLPLKQVGGYAQTMSLSDTAIPVGIGSNGSFDTTNTHQGAVATSGQVPCTFDPSVTVTAGDLVGISSNTVVSGQSIAGCRDMSTGTFPVSGYAGWLLGNIGQPKSTVSLSIPSTPSVSAATISSSSSSTINYCYELTISTTDGSKTESAPSSAVCTSTGPASLIEHVHNTVSNLTSATYNIYRTTLGSSTLPSLTAVMAGGQLAYVTGLPTGTGYTWAPTATFTGGSCTTEPQIQIYAINGVLSEYDITNFGSGCSGTPTITLAKSSCETGWIGQFTGTSFQDLGYCGDGTTPPASGRLAPLVNLAIQYNGTPGTGNVNGPGSSTGGDVASFNGSSGALIQDSGVAASAITVNTAPAWLQYLGNGADGAENCASGTCVLSGEAYYTTFNVASGATVQVHNWLVVHATGACTINGLIAANGATSSVSNPGAFGGGSSGGSGGGSSAGTVGYASYAGVSLTGSASLIGSAGTAGAASGGNGGNGATPGTPSQRMFLDGGGGVDGMYLSGVSSSAGANSGGAAVKGGGGVTLICGSISSSGGVIDVSGLPGNPPNANSEGASGGAGGGVVILSSQAAGATFPAIYDGGGAGGQVSVPYAVPMPGTTTASGNAGSIPPVLSLSVSGGALSGCTVAQAGSGLGSSPSINWSVIGGGGSGGTVTATYSGGSVASCAIGSAGSGYTATTYTTAGTGGYGGQGWYGEYSGW